MYKTSELKSLLFFDIETLPIKWDTIPQSKQDVWLEKYHNRFLKSEIEFRTQHENTAVPTQLEIYNKYAGLYPEFSRVWCISFGMLSLKNVAEVETLRDEDEKAMLEQFLVVLDHYSNFNLSGYNIHGFDIPFVIARMMVHGLFTFPPQLRLKDAKPWTIKSVDFQNDWSGMRRESVSLSVVCETLGVKTPKDKFNNYEFTTLMLEGKISEADGIEYCEKDVHALINCMLKCSSDDCNYGGSEAPKKVWAKKS
jgi:DNA polymerase elongation subunit (family B)